MQLSHKKSFQKYPNRYVFHCTNCSLFTVWFTELLMSCNDLSSTSSWGCVAWQQQQTTQILAAAHHPQNLVGSVTRKFLRKFTLTTRELFLHPGVYVPCHVLFLSGDTSGKRVQCDNSHRTLSVKKGIGQDDARKNRETLKNSCFFMKKFIQCQTYFGSVTVIHEVCNRYRQKPL